MIRVNEALFISAASSREVAAQLERHDPLAGYRQRFVIADPRVCYLDGNSLGRLPVASAAAVEQAVHEEWRGDLVGSWPGVWLERLDRVAALIANITGALPPEVVLGDSVTVNLYKVVGAFTASRAGRPDILSERGNFPTDLYALARLAESAGGRLRLTPPEPGPAAVAAALDEARGAIGVACFSAVDYRSARLAEVEAITRVCAARDTPLVWDLSHAAGVVELGLHAAGVDAAVGCTYKYLNGGPGAPAFIFVHERHHDRGAPPMDGWMGHADVFAMEDRFRPAPGVGRFRLGTPPMLSVSALEPALEMIVEAGLKAIRAKSLALTGLALALADAWLAPHGVTVATPRDPARRGAHVALLHADAFRVTRELIERHAVVPDFREPDVIRVGLSPLTTSFSEVWDGLDRLRQCLAAGAYRQRGERRTRVT